MEEYSLDELPTDLIVCFLEVQFDRHKSRIGFACFEVVKHLLDDYLVLRNPSIWDKSRLSWGNDFVKVRPEL